MPVEIAAALITAFLAAIGGIVMYFLQKSRENETRRLEKRWEYASRQVEEFYGPLYNLVRQIFVAWDIQSKLVAPGDSGEPAINAEQIRAVERYFRTRYFFPLHDEINTVFKNKLHLIGPFQFADTEDSGNGFDADFYQFLRHVIQQRVQQELWENLNIGTTFLPGQEWPEKFFEHLVSDLVAAKKEADDALRGLRTGVNL